MSEIKGQLLGIVLVVAVFGVVGTVLVTAFQSAAKKVSQKIEDVTDPTPASSGTQNNDDILYGVELLKY